MAIDHSRRKYPEIRCDKRAVMQHYTILLLKSIGLLRGQLISLEVTGSCF